MIEAKEKTMKEIIFVTTNKGKVASAQKELKNIKVLSIEAELSEPRSDDIKEIAKQKVLQAHSIVKRPCIALDSGFFISALNGFPRAYVNHMLDTIGIEGILKLMHGEENRACEFRSCLAYYDGEEMRFFESKSPGAIAGKIRGSENVNSWSDLWYIFIPRYFHKTMAEFNEEDFMEYNRVKEDSGMKKFGEWFSVSLQGGDRDDYWFVGSGNSSFDSRIFDTSRFRDDFIAVCDSFGGGIGAVS